VTRAAAAWIVVVSATSLLVSSTDARAQGSLQIPLQFDFLNPGARSLALGSAFVGLADDATAAFTNPAGLLILRVPEVSFEFRGRRLESPFLLGGRLSGPVSGRGVDQVAGALYGDSVAQSVGLSYFSFVLPRGRWSVAGYRHEFVRLDQEFEAQGVFQDPFSRELALRATRKIDITAYGGAVALRINPKLSVGGTLALYTFDLDAQFNRYVFLPDVFATPTFAPATQVTRAEQQADTTGFGVNAGAIFTAFENAKATGLTPQLVQLGVLYRRGPRFGFDAFEGNINNPIERDGTFAVPDALGGGVALRLLNQAATVTGEVTWVRYTSLLDGYVSSQTGSEGKAPNFKLDDGIEIHGGFEYILDVPTSPALRIGAWRDPAHAVRYDAPPNGDSTDERFAAYLPARGGEVHVTFGGGLTLSRQVEFNLGVDVSERTRLIAASAVVRFSR
jgi:long-chain fatty acid transport protein